MAEKKDIEELKINFGPPGRVSKEYQIFTLLLARYKDLEPIYSPDLKPELLYPTARLRKSTIEGVLPILYFINAIRSNQEVLFHDPSKDAATLLLTKMVLDRTVPYHMICSMCTDRSIWIEDRRYPSVLDLAILTIMHVEESCPIPERKYEMSAAYKRLTGMSPVEVISTFYPEEEEEAA